MSFIQITLWSFIRACADLCWNQDKSTPYRFETNDIAENAVHKVKEGTSAPLVQSGLPVTVWREGDGMLVLRNIQDKLADRKSPYEKRFGTPVDGPVVLFGLEFFLKKKSYLCGKTKSRLLQFGTKMLPGILFGYSLNSGGGWTRDLVLADRHGIENKVGINKLPEVFVCISLRIWFHKTRRSRATSNLTPPESQRPSTRAR